MEKRLRKPSIAFGSALFIVLSIFLASQIAQAVGTGSGSSPTPEAEPAIEAVESTPDPTPAANPVVETPSQPEPTPTEIAPAETTPAPTPTPNAVAQPTSNTGNCTTADYVCGEWGECGSDGIERRECSLPETCTDPGNLIPRATERQCEGVKCILLDTVEKRVRCRLELSPEQLQVENDLQYLPEYCRVEPEGEEREECIELYKSFDACWAIPAGEERRSCADGILGTVSDFKSEKDNCLKQSESEQEACKAELEEKIENFALFYMYELEFLSEELWKAGQLSTDDHVALVVYTEERKAGIELAADSSDWKKEIEDLKTFWEEHKKKVM